MPIYGPFGASITSTQLTTVFGTTLPNSLGVDGENDAADSTSNLSSGDVVEVVIPPHSLGGSATDVSFNRILYQTYTGGGDFNTIFDVAANDTVKWNDPRMAPGENLLAQWSGTRFEILDDRSQAVVPLAALSPNRPSGLGTLPAGWTKTSQGFVQNRSDHPPRLNDWTRMDQAQVFNYGISIPGQNIPVLDLELHGVFINQTGEDFVSGRVISAIHAANNVEGRLNFTKSGTVYGTSTSVVSNGLFSTTSNPAISTELNKLHYCVLRIRTNPQNAAAEGGILEAWVDGQLVHQETNILWSSDQFRNNWNQIQTGAPITCQWSSGPGNMQALHFALFSNFTTPLGDVPLYYNVDSTDSVVEVPAEFFDVNFNPTVAQFLTSPILG